MRTKGLQPQVEIKSFRLSEKVLCFEKCSMNSLWIFILRPSTSSSNPYEKMRSKLPGVCLSSSGGTNSPLERVCIENPLLWHHRYPMAFKGSYINNLMASKINVWIQQWTYGFEDDVAHKFMALKMTWRTNLWLRRWHGSNTYGFDDEVARFPPILWLTQCTRTMVVTSNPQLSPMKWRFS